MLWSLVQFPGVEPVRGAVMGWARGRLVVVQRVEVDYDLWLSTPGLPFFSKVGAAANLRRYRAKAHHTFYVCHFGRMSYQWTPGIGPDAYCSGICDYNYVV